jgi:hypothetical protein
MALLSAGVVAACLLAVAAVSPGNARAARHEDLTAFFREWRAFQAPKLVGGVPDYTAAAMAAQQKELETFRGRLAAMDPSGWTVPQQVDYEIVRAELAGLDFDHRVLRPWANNPGFYVTVFDEESDQPAREGPLARGAVELWAYRFPLSADDAARLDAGLRSIPGLLAQAKKNLTGGGRDVWIYGTKGIRQQSAILATLASKLAGAPADLVVDVGRAKSATDDFGAWLDAQAPSKTGPSGVGVANYDWYLANVQLVPYTWRDEVTLMERELARANAALALEEKRNEKLPPQAPIASPEEYAKKSEAAVAEYMGFLREKQILEVRDWMGPALAERMGTFRAGPREFFSEVDYRDLEVMRTHGYHWFDKQYLVRERPASPIRQGALLYNIFNTRTEGHATGWEEMMLHAGMFDARPRSRELVWILVAERAARALGELRMHSNEMTLEEASAFASANTPRGWLSMQGELVRSEQHLYLQQPGYGTSYLIGKIEIEKLLGDRREQLKDGFSMKRFMAEFNAVGQIPASLVRWEVTGRRPAFLPGYARSGR